MLGRRSSIHSQVKADHSGLRGRHATVIAGAALAFALLGASGAQAQNCAITAQSANAPSNMGFVGASPAGLSSVIASTLATSSTAFLLQSTAFIGAPSNPAPDQQGGGVWVRGVGGEVNVQSTTRSSVNSTQGNLTQEGGLTGPASAAVACAQQIHQNFAGVQIGTDIARLNSNGWNIHVGTTAGYVESRGNVSSGAFALVDPVNNQLVGGGAFNNTTQIPFFGTYAAATYGGFFVDGLIRAEYYQTNLNAPNVNLFNQNINAHGTSFSGSIGYNWTVPNSNWFIEPSAGVILSRVTVDPFNFVTAGIPAGVVPNFAGDTLSGTLRLNTINSEIGRVGLRVGTTIDTGTVIWQPFAAVSVWHEFGPNVTSNYTSCPGCVAVTPAGGGQIPVTVSGASETSTFGTYGQYSLGFSAAVSGTGWLGFARVDYRNGDHLEGLSATGGIRYQFTPDAIAKMPVKAPVYHKAPIVEAINWTGFYVGGFGGALLGTADWNYVIGEANPRVGGTLWGGDIGYNYQSGWWVFGVEADLGWTNLNGGRGCSDLNTVAPGVSSPMWQMTCNASANWLATATARIGYAWERALLYVKGGGAWTNEQVSATCNLGPINQINAANGLQLLCRNPANGFSNGFAASTNLAGWTVGYGTEFALTRNWSAKAEYDYVSFGNVGVTANDGSRLNLGMHFSQVKVGVNYRFDMGPVIAKY